MNLGKRSLCGGVCSGLHPEQVLQLGRGEVQRGAKQQRLGVLRVGEKGTRALTIPGTQKQSPSAASSTTAAAVVTAITIAIVTATAIASVAAWSAWQLLLVQEQCNIHAPSCSCKSNTMELLLLSWWCNFGAATKLVLGTCVLSPIPSYAPGVCVSYRDLVV